MYYTKNHFGFCDIHDKYTKVKLKIIKKRAVCD